MSRQTRTGLVLASIFVVLTVVTAGLVASIGTAPPTREANAGSALRSAETTGTASASRLSSLPAPADSSVRPAAAVTLSLAGTSPSALALSWTEDCETGFTSYAVDESTSGAGGPWQGVATITVDTTTSWSTGEMTPGASAWWEVTATGFLCSSTSNSIESTQPALASLNVTQPTGSSAEFNWTNNASYGGDLGFVAYGLYEEVGGGAPSLVQSISSVGTRTFTATGLSGGLGYTFYLNTTDCFAGCGTGSVQSAVTESNAVTFGVPVPLASSLSVDRNVVDTGQPDLFSCNPSGGVSPYNFSWDFGNGTSVPGPSSVSESYANASTPTVDCVVTDHAHTEASAAISILVNTAPFVNVTSNATRVDVGQSVAFGCSVSLGTPSFTVGWTFGDGTSGSGSSIDHTYLTTGPTVATCTVVDATTTTVVEPISLNVSPRLSVGASANSVAAAPGTVLDLNAHAENGSGTYARYAWTFSGGGTASGKAVTHAFATAGTESATVVVTDSNGASNRSVVAVTVAPVSVSVRTVPTNAETGQSLTFNATATGGAGGPYNYTWTFGDGSKGDGAVVDHAFRTVGTFPTSLVVTDPLGATNTTSVATVAVTAPPPPPPLVPLWAIVLLLLLLIAIVAAVGYREFRRRRSAALRSAAPWAPPTDPSRTLLGRKNCPACGASNLPIRETCDSCGTDLPRRTLHS
ncbi:MAG: PKD domain-containing protein [Thermoplasmata archaeon]|nr:PKD domain-containing protein [Thermoplasmata archaeon]